MIKRILIVASCVVLLVCVLVLPASASVLDYQDYVVSFGTDGDYNTYTCYFPPIQDGIYNWYCTNSTAGVPVGPVDGINNSSLITYRFSSSASYSVLYWPLGGNNQLSLDDVPNGTKFTMWVDISVSTNYITPTVSFALRYFDSNMNIISESYSDPVRWGDADDNFPPRITGTLTVQKPVGAVYVCAYSVIDNISPLAEGWSDVTFSGSGLNMHVSVSALYELQQQTGKTNRILSSIEDNLKANGQTLQGVLDAQQDTNDKLDGIINDKVDPSLPSGSDIVGDLDDAEGQIRDDAQSGLDQGASVQQSAIQVLGQYLSAFACVSWIFDRFSTIPFISGLLALSFSLGITGAILGIGLSVFRSYSETERKRSERSARSSRSSRSKGG